MKKQNGCTSTTVAYASYAEAPKQKKSTRRDSYETLYTKEQVTPGTLNKQEDNK